ncbi:MAG: molybdopterin molybdotransferase MoeA, partial [Gammaproteobacteria bacterium]|nr:molybdopterin molybdotransferase MoeA [Gammaproteobacteria bacterium]
MKIDKQPSCSTAVEPGVITVPEAVSNILNKITPITDFSKLHIRQCLKRIVFEDIKSPIDVPGFNNSAMDGYAVSSDDLPIGQSKTFTIVGTAFAGNPFTGNCGHNECVRIMTGAMVPEQADTIVIQEDIQLLDSTSIEIGSGHNKNQNFRYAGEDIKTGSTVFAQGHVIKAADLGVLASLGINEIKVVRKPRVSFFSTGDELKSIGDTLVKGEIYDSNRYSLYGLLSDCDVDIIDMGAVLDDPDTIRQTLLSATACSDVILTSGGVSVGEADYIKGILQEIGNMDIWKIAMKPGRPLTFGQIENSMFFGLPGNPVAVMVTFYQFVKPALNKIKGMPLKAPLSLKATSLSSIRKNPGRREFQRAIASTDENGN